MATKKKPHGPPLSPIERQRCNELIQEFEGQLELERCSRLELGKIARELKPLYVRSGRGGGWSKFVTDHGRKVRTVDEWILDYERSIGLRQPAESKTPTDNVAESATFQNNCPQCGRPAREHASQLLLSDQEDANGRVSVGAVFVLDKDQKQSFLEAIKRLSPAEATRLMYEALVSPAAPKKENPA